jgi:hypothetical protein
MRRSDPSEIEKRKVWAASAGRCAVCGADLLEGRLTHRPMTLGELAHIVGARSTPGSPRGQGAMSDEERKQAANLMLVCAGDHNEIDRDGAVDLLAIDKLRGIKNDHEDWVRRVTGLDRSRGTAVLRMIGGLRGNAVELSRETASATILSCDDRFPEFPLSLQRYGIEIDLRQVPGEADPGLAYWQAGKDKIDEVVTNQLSEAVRREIVRHLSVFAFARLPLLVYLGAQLDDNLETAIYQRHRATESWEWPDDATVEFAVAVESPLEGTSTEAVVLINVSGTISGEEVPEGLAPLPRLILRPAEAIPSPDLISSRQALRSFTGAVRTLLSNIEATAKGLQNALMASAGRSPRTMAPV